MIKRWEQFNLKITESNEKNDYDLVCDYVEKNSSFESYSASLYIEDFERSDYYDISRDNTTEQYSKSFTKYLHDLSAGLLEKSNLILEEGDGGGGGAAAGGGDGGSGSGDVSAGGGVAYANNGNVSGMGAVSNATVSTTPGDPDGSEPGSGDVSFPLGTFTKTAGGKNWGGATGNIFPKMGKMKMNKKMFQTIKKAKDKIGINKTMSFQEFSNL
jgi:hypothetical protein